MDAAELIDAVLAIKARLDERFSSDDRRWDGVALDWNDIRNLWPAIRSGLVAAGWQPDDAEPSRPINDLSDDREALASAGIEEGE